MIELLCCCHFPSLLPFNIPLLFFTPQVPFTDGKAAFAKNVKERGYLRIARAVIAAVHDMLRSSINMPAAYYPLIGEPGMTNFMGLTQDEQEAYYAKHPPKKQVRLPAGTPCCTD
jgi:hypothetical protein